MARKPEDILAGLQAKAAAKQGMSPTLMEIVREADVALAAGQFTNVTHMTDAELTAFFVRIDENDQPLVPDPKDEGPAKP